MKRIVILISGRGSNMLALLDAQLPAQVAAVISNDPAAAGLKLARERGVMVQALDHRQFVERAAFDAALADMVAAHRPDLIVLAGFMRILGASFLQRFPDRVINIHPSLLPAFTGTRTHLRALEEGVRIHGCTVHFVTPQLDHGPIVIQAAVPVLPEDTPQTLATRVLAQEHRIFPQAVRWLLEDRVGLSEGKVRGPAPSAFPQPITSPLIA